MNEEHEQACRTIFSDLDYDGNGFITIEDLAAMKDLNLKEEDIAEFKQVIEEGDEDKDGKVSYEEFKALYVKKNNL